MKSMGQASLEPVNTLLATLPPSSRAALPPLEAVSLEPGMVLYEPHEEIPYVYFPEDALVSIISPADDGTTVEISLVGRDGMVGIPAFLGGVTPYRAVVQTAGSAYRMKINGRLTADAWTNNKAFHTLILKYTNAYLTQVAQSSLCNCYHPVQQRVCRWLMTASDMARTLSLRVTHETMARLLGTRRASVTSTLGLLQKAGLVDVGRGRIDILDREGLRQMCCECYSILSEGLRQITLQ